MNLVVLAELLKLGYPDLWALQVALYSVDCREKPRFCTNRGVAQLSSYEWPVLAGYRPLLSLTKRVPFRGALLPHFGGGCAFFVADHVHIDDGLIKTAVSKPLHDKAGVTGLFR